ncbi:MAG: exodeoxyribonuclease VII large subunit, partial [bacterium]|nr:exodeoxyribonuclease VII large subunit [bacterium]
METGSGKIFSVSELIELLNIGLNKSQVKMVGEVSEVKINPSGHVYFVLKDKKDGSVMNCAIWKQRYAIYGIELREGMEIIVFGHPNIHKTYGFSFIAETIEIA